MHISERTQHEGKQSFVLDALQKAGVPAPPPQLHVPSASLGYRIRARFAAKSAGAQATIGFRRPRSHALVPVRSCPVLAPHINVALEQWADWLHGSHGNGDIVLSQGAGKRPVITLQWRGDLSSQVFATAERLVTDELWAGAQIQLDGASRPAVIGEPDIVTWTSDGEALFAPPGGFVQAHDELNRTLTAIVRKEADAKGLPALELFAGSGNFSVLLARDATSLTTVESFEPAVQYARRNLSARGLEARTIVGDAATSEMPRQTRVIVLDPPREGSAMLAERLCKTRAHRVVMVSCDPATLARDAHILMSQGHFSATTLHVLDMFPQTSHVESVLVLQRSSTT